MRTLAMALVLLTGLWTAPPAAGEPPMPARPVVHAHIEHALDA